jgi:hypothetical protein
MELKVLGLLPLSQKPATGPCPEANVSKKHRKEYKKKKIKKAENIYYSLTV